MKAGGVIIPREVFWAGGRAGSHKGAVYHGTCALMAQLAADAAAVAVLDIYFGWTLAILFCASVL